MAHQYKVGDKVRIKKREGNGRDYPCLFIPEMAELAGKVFIIKEIISYNFSSGRIYKYYNGDNHKYYLKDDKCNWDWHSSMFEPVIKKENTDYSFGDSIEVLGYFGKIRKAAYFYINFDTNTTEHADVCSRIREKCSNFCKIAENIGAIKNITHKDLFPEFPTIEKLVAFVNKINELYSQKPSSESKQILTTQKIQNNEIRFHRAKASCKRGFVPTGRAICSRRCKTAIELGYLSNATCHC